MKQFPFLLLALLPAAGCIVPEGSVPSFEGRTRIASQFNHRGMVFNDRWVAQGDADVSLPTRDEGALRVHAFGNMDLKESTGDAWLPDGHSGKITAAEFTFSYERDLEGFDVAAGVTTYLLPNGLEFPFGERGETSEVFVSAGRELEYGIYPRLLFHYDIDEAEGLYIRGEVSRAFDLMENLVADVGVGLAFSDGDHSLWNYGIDESGLADLTGHGTLTNFWGDHTSFDLTVAGATIVDDDLRDWFDVIGISEDNLWVALGVGWAY